MLSFIMLNVIYAECLKDALYAECHYAEYRYADCFSTQQMLNTMVVL